MQHVDPDQLTLLALGEPLGDAEDAATTDHLQRCVACRDELRSLRETIGLARETVEFRDGMSAPPAAVWDRIVAEAGIGPTTARRSHLSADLPAPRSTLPVPSFTDPSDVAGPSDVTDPGDVTGPGRRSGSSRLTDPADPGRSSDLRGSGGPTEPSGPVDAGGSATLTGPTGRSGRGDHGRPAGGSRQADGSRPADRSPQADRSRLADQAGPGGHGAPARHSGLPGHSRPDDPGDPTGSTGPAGSSGPGDSTGWTGPTATGPTATGPTATGPGRGGRHRSPDGPGTPPGNSEARVLPLRRWGSIAIAAVAAAAVGVVGTLAAVRPWEEDAPAVVVASASASLGPVSGGPGGVTGRAVVVQAAAGPRLEVTAAGLPSPEGYYEVWVFDGTSRMVSVGTLGPDASASLPLPATMDLGTFRVVDISAERYDGEQTHSQDSVLRGTLSS